MLLNKKQATDLAKNWRLGNKFRKKSLAKKHNVAPAASKNTGRVKMGIRMDVESKPAEYYPALDDDGSLVFFTGNPMKRIPLSDLFTTKKAPKGKRTRVPAKENTMINHHLEILKTSFPNEDESVLEAFLEKRPFDIKEYSLYESRIAFASFKESLAERTEYQLVAQKCTGEEVKSSWYKNENELAELQQKCEDNDEYESSSVMKRIVDVDEDEEDTIDYTDGTAVESEEEEVAEHNDVDMLKLTTLALKQIPGSPKQRDTIKKLNVLRKKAGLKPLTEKEIDINDEVNESFIEENIGVRDGRRVVVKALTKPAALRLQKKLRNKFSNYDFNIDKSGLNIIVPNEKPVTRYIQKQPEVDTIGEATNLGEAIKSWEVIVIKPVNKLKKNQKVTVKAANTVTAIKKAAKLFKIDDKLITGKVDVKLLESTNFEEASDKDLDFKSITALIKNPSPKMIKQYGGKDKYIKMLKSKLTKLESTNL